MKSAELLQKFVASFEKLDQMSDFKGIDKVSWELRVDEPDEHGQFDWRPVSYVTERNFLDDIYQKLPATFPLLYEDLVLSYRWAQVDLGSFRLLPNPPGKDLTRLFDEISADKGLWESLLPAGYIQFGRGPDIDYDPVCFDTKARRGRDCRIVKIDHEEILCNYRIKVLAEIASSFEELILQTIERANRSHT